MSITENKKGICLSPRNRLEERPGNLHVLDRLKEQVRRLEGNAARPLDAGMRTTKSSPGMEASGHPLGTCPRPRSGVSMPPSPTTGWTLDEVALDSLLPGHGLDPASLIELKPGDHGDWPATLAFAACLAVRRLRGLADASPRPAGPVLWCATRPLLLEHGRMHGRGLAALGLAPETLIAVEAPREADGLWVLEEGLRSRALSLVVGVLGDVPLTPSRRLGLAAAAGETPALLLTLPAGAAAPSAALRFRLRRLPSAPHPFDPKALGAPRFRLALERCRQAPSSVGSSFDLEWCHVTYRFHLASGVADRAAAASFSGERARG